MHWIVQENLFNEFGFKDLIGSLERRGVSYDIVTVIPFAHELEPDIDPKGDVFVYGSTALSWIAQDRGWTPGTFLNGNVDNVRVWIDGFGRDNCLNGGGVVVPFGSIHFFREMFIRPADDTKAFTGAVFSPKDFEDWQHRIRALDDPDSPLTPNTDILIAPPKKIHAEYRAFIIDGQIITVSLYKKGDRIISSRDVDTGIMGFIQDMADRWAPARAYTLDVAKTVDGPKIIEIGNFNASGLYACNVDDIVGAVERMEF